MYGLKTLAIPVISGLPFILLSAAYGIRNTGLSPANLLDLQIMLLNLKTLYMTSGAAISALLALAAAYALARRRSTETSLLLYFSATYYIMISATVAVGYIRHAQPFYIAPVFFLALAAADAARSGRLAPQLVYTPLLALLCFQAALANDPYQRKTAFNYSANNFPYWEAAAYFKKTATPGLKIYAPMEAEPSHFYLAKYGLAGKVIWDRTMPPEFSAAKAAAAFKEGGHDFLLLPYSPFCGLATDFRVIADELIAAKVFSAARLFDYHGNKLILLTAAQTARIK